MKFLAALIVCFFFIQLLTGCAHQTLLRASENSMRVAPNITLAGSLTETAPRLIAKRKAVVIDLRLAEEGAGAEAELMRSRGISYFNLPVSPSSFDRTTVNQFNSLLTENAGRPIIIHCQSGNRAGLLWAALLKERGTSTADATAAVSPIVTKPGVLQAINKYPGKIKQ